MRSYLNQEKVHIESIDTKLTICSLSARDHIAMAEAQRESGTEQAMLMVCKYGVKEWHDETIEELSANLPIAAVQEIFDHVARLSGFDDAKKSENGPSGDSSIA